MQKSNKIDLFILISITVVATGITTAAIIFGQSFLHILPLYISLIVASLQSKVNRFASLIGGINALIYGLVYIYYGLYGSAVSAILFSSPIQLITFVQWSKNQVSGEVKFKKLSFNQRIVYGLIYLVVQAVVYLTLTKSDSQYAILDSIVSVLGIVATFLTVVPYIEYTVCMFLCGLCNIALYISMLPQTPEQTTYLIYSCYSLICITKSIFKAKKIYNSQNEES